MPAAVRLREDYSGQELRALARRSQDVSQSRRLLSLAAVRTEWIAARQRRLAAWIARRFAIGFIASTPRGRMGSSTVGPKGPSLVCRRSRWRRFADRGSRPRSGKGRRCALAAFRPRACHRREVRRRRSSALVGKLLKKLGSHISARPRHPAQDERIVEGFKKTSACAEGRSRRTAGSHAGRDLVPSLCSRGLCQTGKPHIWNRSACRWSNVCHQTIYVAIQLQLVVLGHRVSCTPKRQGLASRLSFQG